MVSKRSRSSHWRWALIVCLILLITCCVPSVNSETPRDQPAPVSVESTSHEPAKSSPLEGKPSSKLSEADIDRIFNETITVLESLPRRRYRLAIQERDFLFAVSEKLAQKFLPQPLYKVLDEFRGRQHSAHPEPSKSTVSPENPTPSTDVIPVIRDSDRHAVKRAKAASTLRILGEKGHEEAHEILGDMLLYGKYQHARNATEAFKYYHNVAQLGRPSSQRMVGLMYATGLGVERDYAKALLYLSFAAVGEDTVAEQVLGYWHIAGIATPRNCEEGAFYYRNVAEKAVAKFKAGPPGGLNLPPAKQRLSEQDGGIYGYGASGPGDPNLRTGHQVNQGALSTEDVLQYYRLQADAGDALAQLLVGQLFYSGSFTVKRNFRRAMEYFRQAAAQHPGEDILRSDDVPPSVKQVADAASHAMHFLGQMYWRGEGVERNNSTARLWFERGAVNKNAACLNALAVMHMEGIGGKKDYNKGIDYLTQAATENADAQARLGEIFLSKGPTHYPTALKYFNAASTKGNIVALYHLGNMHMQGVGMVTPNCHYAVTFYKSVAERGDWHDPIVHHAQDEFKAGDVEGAFLRYLLAAERGYEIAQTNAAWMLDRGIYKYHSSNVVNRTLDPYETALYLWNRAANQGNVDARVKMGDYHYYGLGTFKPEVATTTFADPSAKKEGESADAPAPPSPVAEPGSKDVATRDAGDPTRAAVYYLVAADNEWSSIAMWNLGWMYEVGVGVDQDYHLAKRFYDRCLETNPEAYLPVHLALAKLRIKMLWSWILTGGPFTTHKTPSSTSPTTGPAVDPASSAAETDPDQQPYKQPSWPDDDDDDVFWTGYKRDHHGEDGDAEGKSFFETFAIFALCAAAAALVVYRQALVGEANAARAAAQAAAAVQPPLPQQQQEQYQQHQQQHQQQQQQQQRHPQYSPPQAVPGAVTANAAATAPTGDDGVRHHTPNTEGDQNEDGQDGAATGASQ